MADFQRVIEFLRDVRQGAGSSGLQTVNEEIAHMAGEYAALCASANDRLRKCTGFLQQGLRAEAIHLAEESPNLLDLVAQLDLPDPQTWAEFCQNNGFPVPPALQMERAAQLNEAYAQDQPLEHLMARHRLLALSRAPVSQRLDVMRKIAALDPNSGMWEKDLRILELARLKELPSAFYNAVKNHDAHAISGLTEELNGQIWFEPPPADLLAAVSDAHARVQRAGVETELRKLVEPLREAFAARSVQECQALVQRWKNLMATAGVITVSGELMDEIRPVVAFIGEQTKRDDLLKRFHEACKAFARMLDADAADAQLEAGYARLKEFQEEIPEDLTRRYMNKRTGRRKDADRTHKLRLATIAGVMVVVLVILLAGGWILLRGNTAGRWARDIDNAVAQHTHEGLLEGQKRIDDLQANNPGMLKEPAVAAALSKLQVAKTAYDADADTAGRAAARIEKVRQAAALVAGRASAGMEEIRTAAADLDAAVNEGNETLAKVDWADEGGKLRTALAGAQTVRRSMQVRVVEAAASEVKAITAALGAIPASPTTPDAAQEARNRLEALRDRANALKSLPLLDASTKADIQELIDRLAKQLQNADVTSGVANELQKIRTNNGSAGDLRAALTSFIARFPGDVRSADFKAALDRLAAAESLDAWQAKMAANQGNLAPANAADAQKRLDDLTAFLAAHPEFPRTAEATQYGDYLKRAADALGDNGAWQKAFDPLVSATAGNRLLTDMGYMQVSDGRRFYTLGDPKRTEHRFNEQVSVSFLTINLKPDKDGKVDYTTTATVTIDPPLTVSAAPLPAAHAKVAGDIRDSLKTLNGDNWDTYGIDLAERLARNDQMDIVVKAIFLQQALKTELAVTGGLLGDIYDKSIDSLGRQKADELPWPDAAKVSEGTRRNIKSIVDDLPPTASVKQRLTVARSALFKSVALDLLSTGVLLKNDAGAWEIHCRTSPVDGAIVWTVVPGTSGTGFTMVMAGTAAARRFVLDDAALKNVPQGNIVYITRQ